MIYLRLFLEFFHTGLFSVGGGYATLPFLYDMADRTGWFTAAQIADELSAFRPRIRLFACLDTLEYLARGGRIPKAAASLGAMVRFKPLITLSDDGHVELVGKGIGMHRATDAIIRLIGEHEIDRSFPLIPIYSHTRRTASLSCAS